MADQTIQYQTGFAPVIAPYAEGLLGAAQAASSTPYQSYQDWAKKYGLSGDQVAAFNPLPIIWVAVHCLRVIGLRIT